MVSVMKGMAQTVVESVPLPDMLRPNIGDGHKDEDASLKYTSTAPNQENVQRQNSRWKTRSSSLKTLAKHSRVEKTETKGKLFNVAALVQRSKRNQAKTLSYSMQSPGWMLICSFHATILPVVLTRVELWLTVAAHLALHLHKTFVNEEFMDSWKFSVGDMGLSITLQVFLLAFFSDQCYSRYLSYYDACCGMKGTLFNLSQLLATELDKFPGKRWVALRYLVTSCMVTYMKVYDRPGVSRHFKEEEWHRLVQSEARYLGHPIKIKGKEVVCPPLLLEEEVAVAKNHSGNDVVLFQTWAVKVVRDTFEEAGIELANSATYQTFITLVQELRSKNASISNTLGLPIPFPYFHALILLMYVNWGLLCIAFIDLDSHFSPVLLFLVIFVSVGIREVAVSLVDPFGLDEVDFPIQQYMTELRTAVGSLAFDIDWPPNLKVKHVSRKPAKSHDDIKAPEQDGHGRSASPTSSRIERCV